jgi:anti-sigma B factor antagonist
MPVTTFSVTSSHEGDVTVLQLVGELDIASVPELRKIAFAELDRPGCTALVLDLAELTFLDSTGVGSWIELRSRAAEHGQQMTIRSVPLTVSRVLDIGGLTALFTGAQPGSA